MKNTFGSSVCVTVFGESHGKAIGAVIDGLCPGITVDTDKINAALAKRRPSSNIDTSRREKDEFEILSGVFNGKTTGTPICIVIPNGDTKSTDYEKTRFLARPSHADYTSFCKYHGYEDYRGGGHFSGRITAAIVAAGAIISSALDNIGVKIGTHILKCASVSDREFCDVDHDLEILKDKTFPVLSDCEKAMEEEIIKAKYDLDSVGGILQTAVTGVYAGVGEPWFDSVESILSHALFSVGGIKGIEFGKGFALSDMRGSQANDAFCMKDGKIVTATNNNGGILGGITSGMPIIFNCAVKPTPSIAKEQDTVDFSANENAKINIQGRHDPAIIRRACPVVESVTAIAICDMIAQRYGTDVFLNGDKI